MGMIKRADYEQHARDAYVMDLSDLEKRGRVVVEQANTQAAQIIAQAKAKRDHMISTASDQGRKQGYQAGFTLGQTDGIVRGMQDAREEHAQELAQLTQLWTDQLDSFEQMRDGLIEQGRTEVIELAAMIARRVVRRVVELDPSVVVNEMRAVLSQITETSRFVLAVHPDDAQLAQEELPSLVERFASCEHAQIVTDASLERGSCVARTSGGGEIDATIGTQLDRIIEALLPRGERGLSEAPRAIQAGQQQDGPDQNDADAQEDAA